MANKKALEDLKEWLTGHFDEQHTKFDDKCSELKTKHDSFVQETLKRDAKNHSY